MPLGTAYRIVRPRLGNSAAAGNCGFPVVRVVGYTAAKKQADIPAAGTFERGDQNGMKFVKRLNSMLDRGGSKALFDHVRNFLICAFLLALGTTQMRQTEPQFFDLIPPGYGGVGVFFIGCVLILFNLYDGIRRIWRFKHHVLLMVLLVLLYLFISIRVIEIAWDFRDLGEVTNGAMGITPPPSAL